jgi:hypothetical protein
MLWGVLFGIAHWVARRSPVAAVTVAVVVISHWVLDWVTHRPDLPLTFAGEPRFGLGLWNSVPATILIETGLFALGVWIYARRTRAVDRAGTWGLWALTGFLLAIFAASLAGPPPPSVTAVAWAGQAMWLIVLAGYWLDRHRTAVPPSSRD